MPDAGALVSGSVFNRWSRYAWCREYVFANHTDKVIAAMLACPFRESHSIFVKPGCGPGVYAGPLRSVFRAGRLWDLIFQSGFFHGLVAKARLRQQAILRFCMETSAALECRCRLRIYFPGKEIHAAIHDLTAQVI